MKTNFLSIFQPFMNACKKSSIPILSYMKVENGTATITDTETWVSFTVDLDDGLYNVINGEAFKNDANLDDYPTFTPGEKTASLVLNPENILNLERCVANDPLRPVMSGIYLTNEFMVSSDAHVLRWVQTSTPSEITGEFNDIFLPSKPLLTKIKQGYEPIIVHKKGRYIEFGFSDCVITQRIVEGSYPGWKGAIPDYRNYQTVSFVVYPKVLDEMVKTVKAFKTKSQMMKVTSTGMSHENIEEGLKKSWGVTFCDTPLRQPDAIIMPIMILDSNATSEANDILGFNPTLLERAKGLYKGTIIVGYCDEKGGVSRAMAVWFEDPYRAVQFYGTINGVTESPKPEAKTEEPAETSEEATALPSETETQPEPQSQPAQVADPEPAQAPTPEPEPIPTPQSETPATPRKKVIPAAETIHIVEYSPKAIAVFGSTKQFKDEFLKVWGRWVPLTDPTTGTKKTAWIFSKKREAQVREIIKAA